jgi:polyferredoxin
MSDSNTAGQQGGGSVPSRNRSDRSAQKLARGARLGLLAAVLVVITGIGIAHQRGVNVVGVDALCPFGGIETLWSLIAAGTLVQRIAASSVILLVGVTATALLFRRGFCGYICPLGAVQEFAAKLGRPLFRGRRPEMPGWLDRPARYLKYFVLVGFTVWTWQAAALVIRPYDPWVAWMHLTSSEVIAEFSIGLAVLGISVAGSLVYDRFFCKYACPVGAFLGLISRLSVFKVRRNVATCTSCSACDKACPVNVKVSTAEVVDDPECINCNECVNVCPVKDTLTVAAPGVAGRRTSIKPLAAMGAVAGMLIAVVVATSLTGTFAWSPPSLASAAQSAGGTFNVEDIRGSMTFAEVATATGISGREFEKRFKLSEADMTKPMKDLAEAHGFDVHTDVRAFVDEKLGAAVK